MIPLLALAPALLLTGSLGLAIGSFTNVLVYRIPEGMSVVSPRSACPRCSTPIDSRDNIPVLSWLLLRGRCRHCSAPISVRYPLVEAGGALAFLAVTAWFVSRNAPTADAPAVVGALLELAALLYLATVSIALSIIDIESHRLPDLLVLPGYAVGGTLLGVSALLAGDVSALGRAAAGAGILVAFYVLLALVKAGGMGLGDIKLAGVLGLYLGWFGWQNLIVGTAAAFLLGGLVSIVLLIVGRVSRTGGIPFGPFMLVGAWIGLVIGQPVTDTYLSLVGLR